ncbi:MAG: hypothetical protein KGM47_12760, partial [Acidobacteriota bacterium]|nr:hypothetical protein [Acidobacteriota bacterium]
EIMRRLKGCTARFILKTLRQNETHAWCGKMLAGFKLPPTVHDESQYRVWQRRFYDMNIWTEKKKLEKLSYMHHNPVKRGLVREPGEWAWSSWRFYHLNDTSAIPMDSIP